MTPGNCPHETMTAFNDRKSNCSIWNRWTNCREVGYCVFEKFATVADFQLSLFEMEADE